MKNTLEKTCIYSIIIILTAQLSMNLFITDFKISVAVICFSALLFLTENFPLLPVACISAAGVYASRILFYWFRNGELGSSCLNYMPEMSFYICYGLLLYLFIWLCPDYQKHLSRSFFIFILIDYLANLSELFFRTGNGVMNIRAQTGILLVAVFRTLILWCIFAILEQYRLLLLKREHEERYRRLLLLISRLNGEIVWMKKNASMIEDTMNTSYKLYHALMNTGADSTLSSSALSISRDIHEIKKEYLLIMRGISEALDQELESGGMYLKDIFRLLRDFILLSAKDLKKTLSFSFSCQSNPYTEQHYALMSIFRNLFMNALEAGTEIPIQLTVNEMEENDYYVFSVTDNGPGIPSENIGEIFEAGFSTKINYSTGEVNRGLGLNLVKDLVETQLKGSISLTSFPGNTTFTLLIPVTQINTQQEV